MEIPKIILIFVSLKTNIPCQTQAINSGHWYSAKEVYPEYFVKQHGQSLKENNQFLLVLTELGVYDDVQSFEMMFELDMHAGRNERVISFMVIQEPQQEI